MVEKCREEIDSIMGQRGSLFLIFFHLTSPTPVSSFIIPEPGEVIKPIYDQLKDMHYIHAVFSETLRLHPPVPVDMKFIVEDDVLPSGLKVYVRVVSCLCFFFLKSYIYCFSKGR